jgi:hypothetical protein
MKNNIRTQRLHPQSEIDKPTTHFEDDELANSEVPRGSITNHINDFDDLSQGRKSMTSR